MTQHGNVRGLIFKFPSTRELGKQNTRWNVGRAGAHSATLAALLCSSRAVSRPGQHIFNTVFSMELLPHHAIACAFYLFKSPQVEPISIVCHGAGRASRPRWFWLNTIMWLSIPVCTVTPTCALHLESWCGGQCALWFQSLLFITRFLLIQRACACAVRLCSDAECRDGGVQDRRPYRHASGGRQLWRRGRAGREAAWHSQGFLRRRCCFWQACCRGHGKTNPPNSRVPPSVQSFLYVF